MDIKVHKTDLPEDLNVGNRIAIDCEFMGLNFLRDKLCLVQISNGDEICHLIKINLHNQKPLNLIKILKNRIFALKFWNQNFHLFYYLHIFLILKTVNQIFNLFIN